MKDKYFTITKLILTLVATVAVVGPALAVTAEDCSKITDHYKQQACFNQVLLEETRQQLKQKYQSSQSPAASAAQPDKKATYMPAGDGVKGPTSGKFTAPVRPKMPGLPAQKIMPEKTPATSTRQTKNTETSNQWWHFSTPTSKDDGAKNATPTQTEKQHLNIYQ